MSALRVRVGCALAGVLATTLASYAWAGATRSRKRCPAPKRLHRCTSARCAQHSEVTGGNDYDASSRPRGTGLALHKHRFAALDRDIAWEQDEGDLPRSRQRDTD